LGRDCGHFFGSKPKPSLLFTSFKAPYLMPAGMEETRPAQLTLQSARNRNAAIHIQNVVLSLSLNHLTYRGGPLRQAASMHTRCLLALAASVAKFELGLGRTPCLKRHGKMHSFSGNAFTLHLLHGTCYLSLSLALEYFEHNR
jgi:hypothetical protein